MSSRRRQTTTTPGPSQTQTSTAPVPRPRDPTIPLPAYEAPLAPLTAKAQQDMQSLLLRTYPLKKMEDYIKHAAVVLQDSTGDINDQLMEKQNTAKRRKTKRDRAGNSDMDLDEKENEDLAAAKTKVDAMTDRMDLAVRKCVDGEASLTNLEKTMKELSHSAMNASAAQQAHEQAQSQAPSQSQRSGRPRVADEDSDDQQAEEADVNDNDTAPSVTQPGRTQTQPPALPSLTPLLTTTLQSHNDAYTSQSLRTRYSEHPYYISFKQITHDAKHPGDQAPPLPPPSSWFVKEERAGSPLPGMTQQGRRQRSTTRAASNRQGSPPLDMDKNEENAQEGEEHQEEEEEEEIEEEEDVDEDIAVARIKISTRCPITLREFKEPVTSRVCSHSFEQSAIHSMIDSQRPPTRGARAMRDGWKAAVQCPVSGCDAKISKDDLLVDKVLVKRIQRIQKSRELMAERAGGDGDTSTRSDWEHSGFRGIGDGEDEEEEEEGGEQSGDDIDDIEDD